MREYMALEIFIKLTLTLQIIMATMCTTFLTMRKFIFSHSVYSYVHSNKKCICVLEIAVLFPPKCDLGRPQFYTQNVFPEYSGWKTKMKFLNLNH
jgi:hypothetical protein